MWGSLEQNTGAATAKVAQQQQQHQQQRQQNLRQNNSSSATTIINKASCTALIAVRQLLVVGLVHPDHHDGEAELEDEQDGQELAKVDHERGDDDGPRAEQVVEGQKVQDLKCKLVNLYLKHKILLNSVPARSTVGMINPRTGS